MYTVKEKADRTPHPAITYPILGVAKRGDQLHYFGFTFPNGWFLVEYNGQLAAVSGLYGKIVQ